MPDQIKPKKIKAYAGLLVVGQSSQITCHDLAGAGDLHTYDFTFNYYPTEKEDPITWTGEAIPTFTVRMDTSNGTAILNAHSVVVLVTPIILKDKGPTGPGGSGKLTGTLKPKLLGLGGAGSGPDGENLEQDGGFDLDFDVEDVNIFAGTLAS